jgi:hypothetical protein
MIETDIANAKLTAEAEIAFAAANPGTPNPWTGAQDKLIAMEAKWQNDELLRRGQEITAALNDLKRLDDDLVAASERRAATEAGLAALAESEVVKRWKAGFDVSRSYGWGSSWEQWAAYIESARPLDRHAPGYFFRSNECPQELKFDDGDLILVRQYTAAKHERDLALLHWGALQERRSALLSEHPELAAIAT